MHSTCLSFARQLGLLAVLLSSAAAAAARPLAGSVEVGIDLRQTSGEEEVRLAWTPAEACRLDRAHREVVLRCERPVVVNDAGDVAPAHVQWRVGFDSVLVSSNTDLEESDEVDSWPLPESLAGGGQTRLVARAEVPVSRSDGRSQRRLTLLRAQWWHYNGHSEMAAAMLAELDAATPQNPDVLAFRARLDVERGRTRRAEDIYRTALATEPRRTDLKRAVEELTRQRAPTVEVERSARSVGGVWTEDRMSISGRRELRPYLLASGRVDRIDGQVAGLRLRSGEIASTEFRQWVAEGSLDRQLERGTRLRGGVSGGPAGLGTFGAVEFVNSAGRTVIGGELNKPFGEFVEGAAQAGSRDRLDLTRQQTLGSRGGAWLVAARNRYRLEGDVVSSSMSLTVGGVYQVRRRTPSMSLQYGFDMEAGIDREEIQTQFGVFAPLNISARRVHVGGVNIVQPIGPRVRLDVSGGYAMDRLGGRGGFGQARLWTPSTKRVNADVWAEYRLHILTTAQRATRVGARVWVTF